MVQSYTIFPKPPKLSPKEFGLSENITAAAGRVCKKQEGSSSRGAFLHNTTNYLKTTLDLLNFTTNLKINTY